MHHSDTTKPSAKTSTKPSTKPFAKCVPESEWATHLQQPVYLLNERRMVMPTQDKVLKRIKRDNSVVMYGRPVSSGYFVQVYSAGSRRYTITQTLPPLLEALLVQRGSKGVGVHVRTATRTSPTPTPTKEASSAEPSYRLIRVDSVSSSSASSASSASSPIPLYQLLPTSITAKDKPTRTTPYTTPQRIYLTLNPSQNIVHHYEWLKHLTTTKQNRMVLKNVQYQDVAEAYPELPASTTPVVKTGERYWWIPL